MLRSIVIGDGSTYTIFVAHYAVASGRLRLWAISITIDFGQVSLGRHLGIVIGSRLKRICLSIRVILRSKDLCLTPRSRARIASNSIGNTSSVPPRLLRGLDKTTATVRKIEEVFEDRIVGELDLTLVVLHLAFIVTRVTIQVLWPRQRHERLESFFSRASLFNATLGPLFLGFALSLRVLESDFKLEKRV